MVQKRGFPMLGEIVICKITRINPNSAFARLDEYNKEGMIHISEISSGWVRDIRQYVKPNQSVIAKVVRLNESAGEISLSLKRVDDKQQNEKMKEYNLNKKAEKMLEIAAKAMGMTLDKAYTEVGYTMQESFGSLYDGFKAVLKNPKLLEKLVLASAKIKAGVVSRDEFETKGERMILNFGHTFGHAIERLTRYRKYHHGEAIGIGMSIAAKLSHHFGFCSREQALELSNAIQEAGLPTEAPRFTAAQWNRALEVDKKTRGGMIHFVFMKQIGEVTVQPVRPQELTKSMTDSEWRRVPLRRER